MILSNECSAVTYSCQEWLRESSVIYDRVESVHMSSDAVPLHLAEWPYKNQEGALRERLQALLRSAQEEGNFDLSRLEGVTVAENLAVALRTFDAGYESDHSAAMRETVVGRMITTLRDGKIQAHIFLPVDAALQLLDPRAPLHRTCTYVFVHECAHVHDLAQSAARIESSAIEFPSRKPHQA